MSNERKFEVTEAAVVALIEKAEKYDVSAEVLFEVFSRGIVAWVEDCRKTEEQYAFNRVDSFLNGGCALQLDKDLVEDKNVIDNSKEDLIEGKRVNDKTRYSVVKQDAGNVLKKYTQKNKGMHHVKITHNHIHTMNDKSQVVKRRDHLGRSIDVKGHLVKEGMSYINNRIALHNAHAEASRRFAGRERDPELRRIDLHRSKKHQHASHVLDILKVTTQQAIKGKKK